MGSMRENNPKHEPEASSPENTVKAGDDRDREERVSFLIDLDDFYDLLMEQQEQM